MAVTLFTTAFLAFLLNFDSTQGFISKDVTCKARKTLVPLDAPFYDLYPFFAEVFRCGGVCSTFKPTDYHCVAKTWNNVSGTVYSQSAGKTKTVTVENHTSCDCACTKSASSCSQNEEWNPNFCSCNCKYPNGPPTPCSGGFSWSEFECKCVCKGPVKFCAVGKEWSHQSCGCVCTKNAVASCEADNRLINATTCNCVEPTENLNPGVTGRRTGEGLTSTILMIAMAVELLILLVLFDLFLYWRYKKGVCNWLHTKCCPPPKDTSRDQTQSPSKSTNV